MIPIAFITAGAGFLYSVDKSSKLDEQAMKKYTKAFVKNEEAQQLVRSKAEYTDKRLVNVAKKKRAIIEVSVPKFVKVYGKIQKIELEVNTVVNEIALRNNLEKLSVISRQTISIKKEFTDKELVCGMITKGLGKMMIKDAERNVSAANNQMRSANVVYSQSESICEVYDAIIERADRIAKVLAGLNLLFIKSIDEADKIIEKNGLNIRNYTDYEKGTLMTCVNIASGLSDIINIPVVDSEGEIVESALEMLQKGELFLVEMKKTMERN